MTPARIKVPAVLNGSSIRELRKDLARAFADESIPAIVLEGSAGCFCRGMDLDAAGKDAKLEEGVVEFSHCLEDIRLGPLPVVALVEGAATAGGVGLAAASDLVMAAPQSSFCLTELLFGLLPAIVLPYLLERMSLTRVRMWALTAETWSADEARSAGLVDFVLPGADGGRLLKSWVRRLGRAQSAAVGLWKRHIAEASPYDRSHGALATIARLRDPQVLDRIRRFANDEEIPWLRS